MELNNAKIKEIIAKNFKWIVLFICVIGFLALAEDVFKKEIMRGDIICIKNKKIGISICANLLIITILNLLLKNIVQRPRPTEYRLI